MFAPKLPVRGYFRVLFCDWWGVARELAGGFFSAFNNEQRSLTILISF